MTLVDLLYVGMAAETVAEVYVNNCHTHTQQLNGGGYYTVNHPV
jgi:hypothetical protein